MVEGNLFLIFNVEKEIEDNFIETLRQDVKENIEKITELSSFSEYVNKIIQPYSSTVAAGFLHNDVLYVKTKNEGVITLYRKGKFIPLLHGENVASGPIEESDAFVFTIGQEPYITSEHIQVLRDGKNIEKKGFLVIDIEGGSENSISSSVEQIDKQQVIPLEEKRNQSKIKEKLNGLYTDLRQRSEASSSRKKFTFVILIILLTIFIWSVVLGYQRRKEQAVRNQIQAVKVEVMALLEKADEVSFLDPTESNRYIGEAKKKVNELNETYGKEYQKEIDPLVNEIEKKETGITKQENKEPEEFFDLTIESKNAVGSSMNLDLDTVAITDKKNGRVYFLSLSKKSLETKNIPEIRSAKTETYADNEVFFHIPGKGFYKTEDSKIKKIIDQDSEWGTALIPGVFNSNIYILDSQKNDVLKYIPTETGYGEKTSYFKGTIPSLSDANSLAIDGSLYIGMIDSVAKFTSGLQEKFDVKTPQTSSQFIKTLTNSDAEQVYVWDKKNGNLTLLSKEGSYVKSIRSTSFQKATDVVVYNNAAYLLDGHSILKIDLN